MACAASVPNIKTSARIRILNPAPGGSAYTSYERALRFIKNGRAHFDNSGQLVFHGRSAGKSRTVLDTVTQFSGLDARPDRAVLPPSPEVLARMTSRGPLRPPMFLARPAKLSSL